MKKVALITGGAQGIGLAIAQNLSRDHEIAAVWHSSPPHRLPAGAAAIQSDLTIEGACARVIDEVIARFGRLDVIVNNAGRVAMSEIESFEMSEQRTVLDVNLLVPGALLAAALPHLEPGAAIVNISSMNAQLPPRGAAIYGASKAALNLWTRGMAKELGPRGIRVNAVAPGAIETQERPRPEELIKLVVAETALGRHGLPEDIAKAVRFLASDEAGFITGEVLSVTGGYRL